MPEKDKAMTKFPQFIFCVKRIFDLVGISGICADQRCNQEPRKCLRLTALQQYLTAVEPITIIPKPFILGLCGVPGYASADILKFTYKKMKDERKRNNLRYLVKALKK